jgi:hypothetical protein
MINKSGLDAVPPFYLLVITHKTSIHFTDTFLLVKFFFDIPVIARGIGWEFIDKYMNNWKHIKGRFVAINFIC